MSTSIEQLAARLDRLERNMMAATTTPQLAFSSVDIGDQSVNVVGALAEGIAAKVTADQAMLSADGKNRVYHLPTTTPPVGPFAEGDLWFVEDEDNRIQRWDGTAWLGFGLGNQAVANLDAGAITTGTLAAELISSDAMDGKVITGATVQTSAATSGLDRVVMDTGGIRLIDQAGNPVISLPTDPELEASFKGMITASGVTIEDGMTVMGKTNAFAVSSVTTVASKIGASGVAPQVMQYWPTTSLYADAGHLTPKVFAKHWGGYYDTANAQFVYGYDHPTNGMSVGSTKLNGDPGTIDFTLKGPGVSTAAGVGHGLTRVMVGGVAYIYVLGTKSGAFGAWIMWFNATTGAFVGSWLKPNTESATGAWRWWFRWPVLGVTDDGLYFTLTDHDGTTLTYDAYQATTGTAQFNRSIALRFDTNYTPIKIASAISGTFDFGANRIIVAFSDVGHNTALSFTMVGNPLIYKTDETFPLPSADSDTCSALFWNGTKFVTMRSATMGLQEHSTIKWPTTDSSKWWAGFTYCNTVDGHETTVSPRASFTMQQRAVLLVSSSSPLPSSETPPTATDPNAMKFYIGKGATDPGVVLANLWNNLGTTVGTLRSQEWRTSPFTGVHPPAVNGFTATVSGVLRSQDVRPDGTPKWSFAGDGTVRIGADEIQGSDYSTGRGQFRLVSTDYGVILRNDNTNTAFLLTGQYDPQGTWNAVRPLAFNNATGAVTMGLPPIYGTSQQPRFHKQTSSGVTTNASGQWTGAHGAPFTPTAVFLTMRASATSYAIFWGSSAFDATNVTLRWANTTGGNFISSATGAWTALYMA